MRNKGPEIRITSSCTNCEFLNKKLEGRYIRDIPHGNPSVFYTCAKSNKNIGYLSDIMNTPDWCEFKIINIKNLIKGLNL